jgi:short-subunit dehydrogenase
MNGNDRDQGIGTRRYAGWAIIAGASEGLGRAFALALARAGHDCLLVARRREALEAVAAGVRACGAAAECFAIDLAASDAAAALVDTIGERPVGVFVYCAGADSVGRAFLHAEPGDWDKLIALNVNTMTAATHAIASRMVAAGSGGILLVSSEGAFAGTARAAVYSGVKAYQLNFGESLWAELAPAGVDVLTIVIGPTDTPALHRALERHDVSLDPAMLARPEETAARALAALDDGPVLVLTPPPNPNDAMGTAAGRRAHVEYNSARLALFYGEDEHAA